MIKIYRSSSSEVFCKKGGLKDSEQNTSAGVSF